MCNFKGPTATSRAPTDIVGDIVVIMARCKFFAYPVIYMSQYDVVRDALVGFAQRTAAKFTCTSASTQQPSRNN